MGIALALRDERCQVIRRTIDSVELARVLPEFDDLDFPYLRLVDPYGDTVFSGYQLKHAVLSEIEALAARNPSESIQGLLDMAREATADVHTYLVFVGD
jgi:hypothetical protein